METDRSDLPVFWEREKPDPWGIVPALKAVARALDLRVDVVRVPRKRVQAAHDGAGRARAERSGPSGIVPSFRPSWTASPSATG